MPIRTTQLGPNEGAERGQHSRSASVWVLGLVGLSLVLLTGCRSLKSWKDNGWKVGPSYCRPMAPAECQWIDLEEDPRLSADSPDLAAWWYSLNDPVLNDLIHTAHSQNLTLRQAGTRIMQAQAIRGIATGNLFPQAQQMIGDYQRTQTSQNVAMPASLRRFDEWDAGMNVGWELDFWGRFRRGIEAADAELNASVENYDDVLVLLLSDVATAYVQIRNLQERLEIARRNVESQEGSLKIADARFQAQQTNKLDVNQAKNNIYTTESIIPSLETQLRIVNNRLCVLLGMSPQDLVNQLPEGPVPNVSSAVQVGIPADLLRRRPDIRRSERQMAAQSARIGIAESELYPHISLLGSIQWQAENLGDLFKPDSVLALIGPSFTWNVLNYGRILNSVRNEQAAFENLVYQYQEDVLNAQREVEDSIAGFLKAQDQAARLDLAVQEIDEAEAIVLTLYKAGSTDFNRVFLIQSVQFAQQEQLVNSRTDVVLNLIKIYRALGGGWEIRYSPDTAPLPDDRLLPEDDAFPPAETIPAPAVDDRMNENVAPS